MEFYRVQRSCPLYGRHQTASSIDGVDFREGSDVATLNAGLFPAQLGEIHTFVFRDPQTGGTFSVDLESQEITLRSNQLMTQKHWIQSLLEDAMEGF